MIFVNDVCGAGAKEPDSEREGESGFDFFALLLRSKVSSSVVVSAAAEQGSAEQAESHARGYGYAVIILTNDPHYYTSRFSHDERKGDPK